MRYSWFLMLLAAIVLPMACDTDEGNYDYQQINEIELRIDKSISVRLSKSDSVLVVIDPELKQSNHPNEENLLFRWDRVSSENSETVFEPYCQTKVCSLWVQPYETERFTIRLTVTDRNGDGSLWYKEIEICPVVPFNRCWFMLQDDNGTPILGAIDGEGKIRDITQNIYESELNQQLPLAGSPKALTVNTRYGDVWYGLFNSPKPVVIVRSDEDVVMLNAISLEKIYTIRDLLLWQTTAFAPSYIYSRTTGKGAELLVDNDITYLANPDGYSIYFPQIFLSGENESYKTEFAIPVESNYILYDGLKHRFLRILLNPSYDLAFSNQADRGAQSSINNSQKSIRLLGENTQAPNEFNPNDIGKDKIILGMEQTCGTGQSAKLLVFAYGKSDQKIHVYEIDPAGFNDPTVAICSGKFEIAVPGVYGSDDIRCASSINFNRKFFIAAGNKVYRVDLNRKVPKLVEIYSHSDESVRVVGLKFCLNYIDPWGDEASYGFPLRLGVAVDYGANQGGLIELNLSIAGDVEKGEDSIHEFKGLGKIVDFGFSYK